MSSREGTLKQCAANSSMTNGGTLVNGTNGGTLINRNDHSYNSLDDDDFELINSLNEGNASLMRQRHDDVGIPLNGVRSLAPTQSPQVSLSTPSASHNGAHHEDSNITSNDEHQRGDSVNGNNVEGERTPSMNQSIDMLTPIQMHHTHNISLLNQNGIDCNDTAKPLNDDFSVIDPLVAVESIRSDYNAAHDAMRKEIEILKKAVIEKCAEADSLSAELKKAIDEKERLRNELTEMDAKLGKITMELDRITAEKVHCDDVIKAQANVILATSGNSSSLPSIYTNEQNYVASLEAKDKQIDELTATLMAKTKECESEHEKVMNLEEIAKVLYEQSVESDQQVRRLEEDYGKQIKALENQVKGYLERGEVNNV